MGFYSLTFDFVLYYMQKTFANSKMYINPPCRTNSTQQAVDYQNLMPMFMNTKVIYYNLINTKPIIINANRDFCLLQQKLLHQKHLCRFRSLKQLSEALERTFLLLKLIWTKHQSIHLASLLRNNNIKYLHFLNYLFIQQIGVEQSLNACILLEVIGKVHTFFPLKNFTSVILSQDSEVYLQQSRMILILSPYSEQVRRRFMAT